MMVFRADKQPYFYQPKEIDAATPLTGLQALLMGLVMPDGAHPLRKWNPCPGAQYRSSHNWPCKNGWLQWGHHSSLHPVLLPCPNCKGATGRASFNPDIDVLFEAVRAKGWFLCYFAYYTWDEWVVQNSNGDPISKTTSKDNLRGTHAIWLAVCLAIQAHQSRRR